MTRILSLASPATAPLGSARPRGAFLLLSAAAKKLFQVLFWNPDRASGHTSSWKSDALERSRPYPVSDCVVMDAEILGNGLNGHHVSQCDLSFFGVRRVGHFNPPDVPSLRQW